MSFRGKGNLNEIPMVGIRCYSTFVIMLWSSFASIWSCAIVLCLSVQNTTKRNLKHKNKANQFESKIHSLSGEENVKKFQDRVGHSAWWLSLSGTTEEREYNSLHKCSMASPCLEYWTTLAKTNTMLDWMFCTLFNNFHSLERKFLWFVFFPPRKEHLDEICVGCAQCS